MHSFLSRLNSLFAFMCSVLAGATFFVFIQTLFVNYSVPVDIDVTNIRVRRVNDYANELGRSDRASMSLSFTADINPVFNWNVKLVYFWLQADYETKERPINSLILWDKYYARFNENTVKVKDVRPMYDFQDDGQNLIHKNVTYSLHWTVVPNAGWMRNIKGDGHKSVIFPVEYKL